MTLVPSPPATLDHVLTPPPLPLAELQQRAGQAAGLLKLLANADRLLLLCHLVDGEKSVSVLQQTTGIPQPNLSQQLAVLRGQGLVEPRREGKSVVYHIASPVVQVLLHTLCQLYCGPQAVPEPVLHHTPAPGDTP